MSDFIIIAIDGPVGSGKSTVARAVGERLGLAVLETGAMYRAVAAAALRRQIEPGPDTVADLVELASTLATEDGHRLEVGGEDVTAELRNPAVNRAVSSVAAEAEVRAELVRRQREWAEAHGGGVVEGRDIGTVVFPNATVKVFLTASEEERARRRNGDEDAADLARRDRLDSTRAASPLVAAEDALVIDSTGRSVADIVDEIVSHVREPGGRARPERPPVSEPTAEQVERAAADAAATDRAVKPPNRADRLLYAFVRNTLTLFGKTYWRASFIGLEHVPSGGPFVLAATHRSNIDFALVSGVARRRIRYMGKDSLWKSKALGAFISALGAFPVHRGTADRESVRRCIKILENGEPLVLFPEGMRRSGPVVEDLHDGTTYIASRAGVPIIPVGIGGSERALGKGQYLPRPVKVVLVIGPPLPPPPTVDGKRPSRRAMREATERLGAELQKLMDEAEAIAAGRR